MKADPKYKKLSPEKQAAVRADLYKKYVPQSYSGFHLPVPDEKTWVQASGRDLTVAGKDIFTARKLSESYNDTRAQQFGQDFYQGVSKAYSNMELFGAHVTNRAFSAAFDLDKHYSRANEAMLEQKLPMYKVEKQIQQKLQNLEDSSSHRVQSADFWLQTHPRDTVIGKLASDSGEFVASLPLYEALGSSGIAEKALGKAAGSTFVTARLAKTPVGQFVSRRLVGATNMYLATLAASGGNQQAAVAGAVGGEVLGSAAEGLAAAAKPIAKKIASAPLTKKWLANVIAMGGKPFAQDVGQSAWAEAQPLDWWLKNGTEANITKYGPGTMQLSKDLAIFPKDEVSGHFVNTKTGETYWYNGVKERQLMFDHLHKDNLQVRAVEDPVMDGLHKAATTALDSIAQAQHGKPLTELSEEQSLGVLSEHMGLIEDAASEAPVHAPDLYAAETEHTIAQARQADPALHALMSQDEQQFGAKFVDAEVENGTKQISKQTGISNTEAAAKKTVRATRIPKSQQISPSGFASLNADSIAYLRAPRDRSEVDFINSRSSDAYDKTYQLLKKADGGFFRAEKPIQRFLYHYANKAKLPAGLRQSVLHWIKQTPEFQGKTEAEIFKAAKNMHVHMYDMAKSGRLKREGNVFASTKFSGPAGYSPWQQPLSDESDQASIAAAAKALQRHPDALKGFMTSVKTIQKQMLKAKTPEEVQMFKDALDTASRAIRTHISRGTAKFGEVE